MVDVRMTSQLGKDGSLEYDENRDEIFIKDKDDNILYRAKVTEFRDRMSNFLNEVNILRSRYKTTKKKSFFNT
jgi:hypothetical protein